MKERYLLAHDVHLLFSLISIVVQFLMGTIRSILTVALLMH